MDLPYHIPSTIDMPSTIEYIGAMPPAMNPSDADTSTMTRPVDLPDNVNNPAKSLRKAGRSCMPCFSIKARCESDPGSDICKRCVAKNLECAKPTQETRGRRKGEPKVKVPKPIGRPRLRKAKVKELRPKGRPRLGEGTSVNGVPLKPSDEAESNDLVLQGLIDPEILPSSGRAVNFAAGLQSDASKPNNRLEPNGLSHEGSTDISVISSSRNTVTSIGRLQNSTAPNERPKPNKSSHQEPDDPKNSTKDEFPNAPLRTLFQNDVLQQAEEASNNNLSDSHGAQRPTDLTTSLLYSLGPILPTWETLTLIIQACSNWPLLWQTAFPTILSEKTDILERAHMDSILDYIAQSWERRNPPEIARLLLCIAISLQQLPINFPFSYLRAPAEIVQEKSVAAAEALLAPDEGSVSTLDGLDCLLLVAHYYVNLGKPRKAWLVCRRAVGFANLLGLHRQHETPKDDMSRRQKRLWLELMQSERFLSLVLGLPYSAITFAGPKADAPVGMAEAQIEGLILRLNVVYGEVIDRNQGADNDDYWTTMKIDQDLEECRKLMPEQWWVGEPDPGLPLEAINGVLVTRFLYHNVRALLHLPFLLRSCENMRVQYNRVIALQSSREIIDLYRILRDERRPLLFVCNVVDYQVFTAAMILIIDSLGISESTSARDHGQDTKDSEMIGQLVETFRHLSETRPCSVAKQAHRVLDDICKARHQTNVEPYEATIPYLGNIRFGRGKRWAPRTNQMSNFTDQLQGELLDKEMEQDPLLSFDSFYQPQSADSAWPGTVPEWMSMVEFDLRDDWVFQPEPINVG